MSRLQKNSSCCGAPPRSKRDNILKAAQEIFLESGYAAASMDAVAARANVSKATIYAHFDNKRALFEAVIGMRCAETFGDLNVPVDTRDVRETLRQFGENFLNLILSPEALAIHRVVMSEAPRLPEVGEAFYFVGPTLARGRVSEMFRALAHRGLLELSDCEIPLLTDLFMSMLKSDLHMRAMLQLPEGSYSIPEVVDMAVDLVLARYGKKG